MFPYVNLGRPEYMHVCYPGYTYVALDTCMLPWIHYRATEVYQGDISVSRATYVYPGPHKCIHAGKNHSR